MTATEFFKILARIEKAKDTMDKLGGSGDFMAKVETIEAFLSRYGSLDEVIIHLEEIEKKLYMLKDVMTVEEAADFMGVKKSLIYKMTHNREISFFKPNGKGLYFERSELIDWMKRNPVQSAVKIEQEAIIESLKSTSRGRKAVKKGGEL